MTASTRQKNIPIAKPSVGEEEWKALKEPIMTGWLTSGPKVKEFEEAFAKHHDVKYAVACTSATTALHLALKALDIGDGDEVIVPAFTWVATANAVLYCGAKPVFADIEINTFNISAEDVKHKVNAKTKAIIPVHLFGLCADMDKIKEAAPGIPIVEDAACASGAKYKGKYAGGLGTLGCFSFHPRKSITTGEGGMVTTNNDELAKKVEVLRNHGASVSEEQKHHGPKPYLMPEFDVMGFNYRMTDLQAAIGLIQLKKLEKFIKERDEKAKKLLEELSKVEWLDIPKQPEEYRHGWQSFVTLVDKEKAPMDRESIMDKLQTLRISTRPGTHSIPTLKFFKHELNTNPYDFQNSLYAHEQSMALPLFGQMKNTDLEYIINNIKNI